MVLCSNNVICNALPKCVSHVDTFFTDLAEFSICAVAGLRMGNCVNNAISLRIGKIYYPEGSVSCGLFCGES
jgi:hypothetical protein